MSEAGLAVVVGHGDGPFEFRTRHLSGVLGADGGDVSPRVSWRAGRTVAVRSFALVLDDPDAPSGPGFWHWGVYDLSPSCTVLEEGAGSRAPTGGSGPTQARNDAGFVGYVGPAPPPGHGPHRYRFRVFALDVPELSLPEAASVQDLEASARRHEIAAGETTVLHGAAR